MSYAANWAKQVIFDVLTNGAYVLAILWTFNYCMEKNSIGFTQSHRNSLWLSLLAVGLLLAFWLMQRFGLQGWPWRRQRESLRLVPLKIAYTVLICATIFSAFNYYKFNKIHLTTVDDYMDVTYYYVNSKYYEELGHFDLYPALLIADEEGPKKMGNVRRIRDLRSYKFISRKEALAPEAVEAIKANFSPERWEAFKHDVAYLTGVYNGWSYLMIDRGYNPPASWTAYGGILSSLVPIEKLKLATSIDILLMLLAFGFIYRAFGITACLFAILWFCVTFSGRWPMVGQAMLRFDWVAALTIGVCLLKMRWYTAAGATLALSVFSRVFPAIFFFPYIVVLVRDVIRERAVSAMHRRFIAGWVGISLIVIVFTLARLGPDSLKETLANLKIHGESYSAHRVGLAVVAIYRGETSDEDIYANGGFDGKRQQVNALKPKMYIVALGLMGLIALYIVRTRAPVHAVIHLGILPLFCIAVLQTNYYNLRILLAAIHASDLSRWRNKFLLSVLFLVETLTQAVMITQVPRYVVTSWMSYGLLAYLLCLVAVMCYEIGEADETRGRQEPNPAPQELTHDPTLPSEPIEGPNIGG